MPVTPISPTCNINMLSEVVDDNGTMTFKITTTVEDSIDVPVDLFVMYISDTSNVNLDTFARVATISDLQTLSHKREDALDAGQTEYRVAIFTKTYDDVEVAAAAKTSIKTRLSSLMNQWETYVNEFLSVVGGDDFNLPVADPSILEGLVTDYNNAKSAREQADDTLAEANQELEDAESTHTNCIGELVGQQYLRALVNELQGVVTTMLQAQMGLENAVVALGKAKSYTTGTQQQEMTYAYNSAVSSFADVSTGYGETLVFLQGKEQALTDKEATCNTNLETLIDKQRDVAIAEAEQQSAQDAEDEALSAVQDACPGWTPS